MPFEPTPCDDDGCPRIEPIPVCFTIDSEDDSITVVNSGAILNPGTEFPVTAVLVQILPANPNRKKLIVQNTGLANVRIGDSTVTQNTGVRLIPDGAMIIDMPDVPINSIWAIRETGTDTVVLAQEISS